MSTIEEQRALEQLRSAIEEERAAAAAVLARGAGDEIDEALLELFGSAWERDDKDCAFLVSRILAERDPDRDPAYAERLLLESPAAGTPSRRARLEAWTMGPVPLAAIQWGFHRLRRLEPVRRYAEQLREGAMPARLLAVIGLGQTADAAAFDVLLTALSDRRAAVRDAAAQSVRRLAASGLEEVYLDHPVRQRLVELLSDRKRPVRVHAAWTLYAFGDEARVVDALAKATWWQRKYKRELESCLRGEIPPLTKTWIGDER